MLNSIYSMHTMSMIFNRFYSNLILCNMEKETNEEINKLDALAKCVLKQEKDIKQLKKKSKRRLTEMKFVGVPFDPQKYKAGEIEINNALSDGFEVLRDFETGGGIVMALGKWEKVDKKAKKEWNN